MTRRVRIRSVSTAMFVAGWFWLFAGVVYADSPMVTSDSASSARSEDISSTPAPKEGANSSNTASPDNDVTLPAGLTPPEPRAPIVPIYPKAAYQNEKEADVYADVALDAQGEIQSVTPTKITLFWYDEDGQLVQQAGDIEADRWGFVAAAKTALKRSVWSAAVMVDTAHPGGHPIPVVMERRVQFLWDEAHLAEDVAEDADAAMPNWLKSTLEGSEDVNGTMEQAPDVEKPVYSPGYNPNKPVNFEGQLVVRGTREPLSNVHLAIYHEPDGPRIDVYTDEKGKFSLRGLENGDWYVLIDEDAFEPFEVTETLRPGEATVVKYRLRRTYFHAYRSQTVEEQPAREVTRRTLDTQEIQRIPGTNNDPIRAVQNLPGVARAPFGGGELIVRGSEAQDSGYYIDGMPVPGLYHFGGLRAVIPSELVESLDFYPGNFGVRYGRATAGILNINTPLEPLDKWHGHVDINLFDAGAFVEGPISKKLTLQVGLRRSYIDGVLAAAKKALPISLTVAPRYYDYQARLVWKINHSNTASLMFFGSNDLVDILLNEEDDLEPSVRGGFRAAQGFNSLLLRVDSNISDRLSHTLRAIGSLQKVELSAGDDYYLTLHLKQFALRDELKFKANDQFTLHVGLDVLATPAHVQLNLPRPPTEGQQVQSFDEMEVVQIGQRLMAFAPALYVEGDYHPVDGLQIIPGVRVDYNSLLDKWSLDGRLDVRYNITDDVVIKGAVGNYHRAPDPNEMLKHYGNPYLGFEQAIQYSLGAEWQITDALHFDVDVFYKDLRSLVSSSTRLVERGGRSVPEVYNNGGRGRVIGAEFFLRHKLAKHFFGWLTYTVSRSLRKDFGADQWRLFDHDQTHILSLIFSYNLPKNWTIGTRFRLVSGNLYTPVVGSVYDASTGTYVQAFGDTNSDRMPLFHQLDVRIDKRWILHGWTLNLYLDIQNIYNQRNPEGTVYNFDYSRSARVSGLPFIPAFGLRGEF